MKCSKCRGLLVEFSEGRLESALDRDIREHVAGCAACRRDLDGLRSSLELVDAAKTLQRIPEPPTDFAERVMERVRRNGNTYFRFRRVAFSVTAACCFLILGAAIFFLAGHLGGQCPTTVSDGKAIAAPESDSPTSIAVPIFQSNQIIHTDAYPLHQVKIHIGMELVRSLGQILEVIERGEQQWEIEI